MMIKADQVKLFFTLKQMVGLPSAVSLFPSCIAQTGSSSRPPDGAHTFQKKR